jgi:5'-nucleotidase
VVDASLVVLVDMDGVLADFDRAVVEALRPTCPDIRVSAESHRMHLAFPGYAQQIRAVTGAPGFFAGLEPIQDALAGWRLLGDLGYRPRICSSPLAAHPDCEGEKRAWVANLLGEQAAVEAYIVEDKCACPGIALIDDIPSIECASASWEHIVFDMPYNRHSPALRRLGGWRDRNLPSLLADAQRRYRERNPSHDPGRPANPSPPP